MSILGISILLFLSLIYTTKIVKLEYLPCSYRKIPSELRIILLNWVAFQREQDIRSSKTTRLTHHLPLSPQQFYNLVMTESADRISCNQSSTKTTTAFTKFPDLPPEIRLKIWSHACHVPRNVAVSTEFKRCEIEDTIFYTQLYKSRLAASVQSYPALLATNQESREAAMSYYEIEFTVRVLAVIHPSIQKVTMEHPGFWFNHCWDRFLPMGFYNIVAMDDIFNRLGPRITSMAIDITSDFFTELFSNNIITKNAIWPFPAVNEVILYSSAGVGCLKNGYSEPYVEIDFEDLEEVHMDYKVCEAKFFKTFDNLDKMAKEWTKLRPYEDNYGKVYRQEDAWVEGTQRPVLRLMKVVTC